MCVCVCVCVWDGWGRWFQIIVGFSRCKIFSAVRSNFKLQSSEQKKKHYFGDSSGAEHLAGSRRDPENEAIGHLLYSFTHYLTRNGHSVVYSSVTELTSLFLTRTG